MTETANPRKQKDPVVLAANMAHTARWYLDKNYRNHPTEDDHGPGPEWIDALKRAIEMHMPPPSRPGLQSQTMAENSRGEWVPAIPLPYYLPFGFRRCDCGVRLRGDLRYREHYALVHVLGLS